MLSSKTKRSAKPKYKNELLNEREEMHGDYGSLSVVSQRTKELWRAHPGWHRLSECQRESLEMIAVKVSRILNGDADFEDNWGDISGYADLISSRLNGRLT